MLQQALAWPQSQESPMSRVFSGGREARSFIQMCEMWRGPLCWPELFWVVPYKEKFIRHYFIGLPCKKFEPRPQCKYRTCIFKRLFRIVSSPLSKKELIAFIRHSDQCLFPSPQNAVCFTNLSRLVLEIFKFFEYHAQNLNTPENNSASWDLQMGFNSAC
jgi:hypothetical protein